MSGLPHITFIIRDTEGGVAAMNHQIIGNAAFKDRFTVRVVLWRALEETAKSWRDPFRNVDSIDYFHYSRFDNYFFTLKKFNTLLNKFPGIIVTNDGIELEAIRKFGTGSLLFSIVHDFYNLKLAIENQDLVDYFICHTSVFSAALSSSSVLMDRVKYLLHGVKLLEQRALPEKDPKRKLRIVSISRLAAAKGVMVLFDIDKHLVNKGIDVEWVIIGSGEMEPALKKQWKGRTNISFHQPDKQEQVFEIASACDIFISPSSFEGYGIALLEAMSCGLVPVIHRLPVGVYSDLPEEIGFSVPVGDTGAFADRIARLDGDRQLLSGMAKKANELVAEKYDISKTAGNFLDCFARNDLPRINRQLRARQTVKLGVLDSAYIPGRFTRMIRKMRSKK